MNEDGPLFILAGNGPYENRGCEAIVRGTVKILREHFKDPRFVTISHFQSEEQYREQCLAETDWAIVHFASQRLSKKKVVRNLWKPETWKSVFQYYLNKDAFYSWTYADMLPYLGDAAAVLSVGGDNYSLDYGVPTLFTALDDLVLHHGKPIALWGASVGPFSARPDYERYMSDHLQKVTGIFARESATIKYLEEIGVTRNVHSVADPAFLMDPEKPVGIEEEMPFEDGAIGLNLSPLLARYVTGGDIGLWTKVTASIISGVVETTEMQVYLIPHAMKFNSDDFLFMQKIFSQLKAKKEKIILVSPRYNAAEIKWIISQMTLFAGARTHATIAALSSGIPTLSFGYSNKALGINQDIFGHIKYCLSPVDMEKKIVINRLLYILDSSDEIKRNLQEFIPRMEYLALHAGSVLKQMLESNPNA